MLYHRAMEYRQQSLTGFPPQGRQILLLLNLGIAVAAAVSFVLLFLTIAGYGHVRFSGIPADATVSINGHRVIGTTFKTRPGSYQIVISSPLLTPYQGVLRVGLFRTVQYRPSLHQRSPDAIASSLLGAIPGSTLPPKFDQARWFSNNTWIAGSLKSDDTVLALHYDSAKEQWSVAFCNAAGYPSDTLVLPSPVASYVQSLIEEAQHDA